MDPRRGGTDSAGSTLASLLESAIKMVHVPAGYLVRRPTRCDLTLVAELMVAYDLAQLGEATTSAERLAQVWNLPRFSPETDGWLVEDARGRAAAYAGILVSDPDFDADFVVHPDHEERGVDAPLLHLVEQRVRELAAPSSPDRQAKLGIYVPHGDERRRGFFAATGYSVTHSYYRMVIDLPASSRPSPPPGISIRTLRLGQDERPVFAALDEAFRDHARYVSQPFEDFVHSDLENPLFDAALWLLACDGDEVAGVAGSYDYPTGPEVDVLAVRRPWRRKGLGKALLLQSFSALARRGRTKAQLSVDAANEDGAVQLYEAAGMRAAQVFDCFTRILRPL